MCRKLFDGTQIHLNLRILVTHLYTEFQFKMSICNGDNERKLKINGIFLSPRAITLLKIIRPDPHSNSTSVFSWQTYVPNIIWISPCMTEIMSGNWIQNDGRKEWRKDGMTEWRKGVTLYAPAILWREHKKPSVGNSKLKFACCPTQMIKWPYRYYAHLRSWNVQNLD